MFPNEANHVFESWIVAQLQLVLARDVERLANACEHLGLLHRVDTEIGLEIEIEVEHVSRIAGLLAHEREHLFRDRVDGRRALTTLGRV